MPGEKGVTWKGTTKRIGGLGIVLDEKPQKLEKESDCLIREGAGTPVELSVGADGLL
ncbi:MAG: hypothetical protein ACLUDU_03455 [Butyricimonas faecihominis]